MTPQKFPGALRNQRRVSVNDLLHAHPQYGAISLWNAEGVYRYYQSIQLKAQRPFGNGFNFPAG